MPTARPWLAAGVIGDKLYVVGGDNRGYYLNTLEVYNPATNTWETKAAMPTARSGLAAGVVGGKLYVVEGNNDGYLKTLEVYDPLTNTWETNTAMPTGRWGGAAGVIEGKLYVVGGSSNSGYLNTLEVMVPATLSGVPPEQRRIGTESASARADTSYSVAVLPLDCPGFDHNAATALTEQLRFALHKTGVFEVMERARMEAVMQEQAFALSACASTECAIEAGHILASPYIVIGQVGKVGDTWSVTLRVVGVETSRTPAMASQICVGCRTGQLLQESVPQAAAALAEDMLRTTARRR
jgi:TolB-like protein